MSPASVVVNHLQGEIRFLDIVCKSLRSWGPAMSQPHRTPHLGFPQTSLALINPSMNMDSLSLRAHTMTLLATHVFPVFSLCLGCPFGRQTQSLRFSQDSAVGSTCFTPPGILLPDWIELHSCILTRFYCISRVRSVNYEDPDYILFILVSPALRIVTGTQ